MSSDSVEGFIRSLEPAFLEHDPSPEIRQLERENLAMLHRVYQHIALREYAALVDCMTADVELEIHGPPEIPFIGQWKGQAQVLAAIERNFTFVRNQRPEIINLTA